MTETKNAAGKLRAEDVSDTKRLIMSVAAKLFAEKGYGGAGISEVGDAAGFGKGALYYHIKSKEDLLFDIMTVYMIDLIEAARSIEEAEGTPQDQVFALSRSFMEIMFASRPEMTVCFREVHALSEGRRKDVLSLHSEYQEIWVRVLARGAEIETFRQMTKIEIKALLGMYFYSFLWVRADGPITIESIADSFTGIVLRAAGST
jgi:AcrR family transcriptional regulator